jgi:hypothetical protein
MNPGRFFEIIQLRFTKILSAIAYITGHMEIGYLAIWEGRIGADIPEKLRSRADQ